MANRTDLDAVVSHFVGDGSQSGPSTDEYRRLGDLALNEFADWRLIDLYPAAALSQFRINHGASVSTRLGNILRRWRGLEWHTYAEVTPRMLWERNGCGIRSVGEFIFLAGQLSHRMELSGPVPEGDTSAALQAGEWDARDAGHGDGGGDLDRSSQSSAPEPPAAMARDLARLIAWAVWERGASNYADAVLLAATEPTVPDSVSRARTRLEQADLRAASADGAAEFDAIRQIERFRETLNDLQLAIVDRRLHALERPAKLDDLGRGTGISRERVRQIEAKVADRASAHLRRVDMPAHRIAARLGTHLGVASQLDALRATGSPIEELGLDVGDQDARALLWLAGPYELREDWLIRRPAAEVIDETKEVLRIATSHGPTPVEGVVDALTLYGIPPAQAREWIVSVSAYRIEDDLVFSWSGSMADKAVTILSIDKRPMTAEELHERLGGKASVRGLANQLSVDPRVKRTGVRHYGLRDWEQDEYTSVAAEIEQEIERQGGAAPLDHLVDHISRTYGVAPASVRTNAASPRFARDSRGLIVVATTAPQRRPSKAPHEARNVFRHGNAWSYRQRITADLLRGSGFPVSTAFADAIGLAQLETRIFSLGDAQLVASWPVIQPLMGSIRTQLLSDNASEGDIAFIDVEGSSASISVAHRRDWATRSGIERLAIEVGFAPDAGLTGVALAIGLEAGASQAAVSRRLQARGEADLAALLVEPDDGDSLELTLDSGKFVEVKWSK